jgi:hypothetical protein
VKIVSVDVEYGPTVDGREVLGLWARRGETVAVRLTVPLKLLVPFTVIVKVVELPLVMNCEDGLAVSVKSWIGLGTVMETVMECEREPLVPVTVSVYVPGGVELAVHTVRMDVAVPLGDRETVTGFKLETSPEGEMEEDMVTLPLKLLILVTLMFELPQEPCAMLRLEGAVEIWKSGGAIPVTAKNTFTEWDRLPLFPKTVTLPEPPPVPPKIESVAVAVPFDVRLRLVGLTDQVLQLGWGQRGDGDVDKETVPVNPLRLVSVIVEVPVVPAGMLRLVGLAVMLKSGVPDVCTTVKATVALWESPPLVPVMVSV